MNDATTTVYCFGDFTFDPGSGLLKGPAGDIALRPKSLGVLLYLMRNAGRVVSKDELLEQVWSGLTVTDDSLSQCIHDIRRVLADHQQSLVRTVPRRGYIFPAEAMRGTTPDVSVSAAPPSLAKVEDRIAIAVLPFSNLDGEGPDFFANGMTEDITTALSRIGQLAVIAPAYRGPSQTEAGSGTNAPYDLAARYELQGTVRSMNGRLRVTVQLTDALSRRTLWAERFDGRDQDVFEFLDEITRAVALAVQAKLTFGDLAHLWEGQTRNLRAWEKMVQGRNLFLQFNHAGNREAQRVLEEAIAIDPRYTGALIQLGLCYWWRARYVLTEDKAENLRQAGELAERALTIDPLLGSAHMLKGGIAFLNDQHDRALEHCERAVALAPSDAFALAYLGLVCSYSRCAQRGIEVLKTALRLSPQPLAWYYESLSAACLWAGELREAVTNAEINFRLEPEEPLSYIVLATALGFAGRNAEATQCIAEMRSKFPTYSATDILLSERYLYQEDLQEVLTVLRRAGLPGQA